MLLLLVMAGLSLDACGNDLGHLSTHFKTARFKTMKPDAQGPLPAVVMASGWSGFNSPIGTPHYDSVQRRLRDIGFVVLPVDYLAACGHTTCDGGVVRVADAATDVVAVDRPAS